MTTALESLLNTVASQVQLSSPLGRFLRKLAQTLVASGVTSPDYGFAKLVGDQAAVGASSNISLNTAGMTRGVTFSGVGFLLRRGKTYSISAGVAFSTFSNTTGGEIDVKLVDDNNNPITSGSTDSPSAVCFPATQTSPVSPGSSISIIASVPVSATDAQRTVKLRCTGATGTATAIGGACWLMVEEIPG